MSASDPSAQMRRVRVAGPDDIRVEKATIPQPRAGELLIRSQLIGVCGSDLHAVRGDHPFMTFPFFPGHEIIGQVAGHGPGVSEPDIGSRIVVEPNLFCGHCKQCKSGRYNLCEQLAVFGCTTPAGGMSDYFVIAADRVHLVPAGFSDAQAALIEPLSTPVHAVRLAGGDLTDRTVAILGAGTIGLLTLAAVRAAGARRVVVTDLLKARRDRALRLGADAVVDAGESDPASAVRSELGESADVVFDCVSVQSTVDQAITMALKGGTVIVVGVAAGPVNIALQDIQDKQIKIQGSAMYTREDYAESMALIGGGHIQAQEIVTAVVPLDDAADAFRLAKDSDQVKVIIHT